MALLEIPMLERFLVASEFHGLGGVLNVEKHFSALVWRLGC